MIMSDVEISSYGELQGEISGIKGVSGPQTGGPPPEPMWRPLLTWRRVLRTMSADLLSVCLEPSLFEIKDSSISSSTEATSDLFRFARQN